MDLSLPAVIVVVLGLAVACLLIYLSRGGKLKTFRLNVLKGMLDFNGTIDTQPTPAEAEPMYENTSTGGSPVDLANAIMRWLNESTPYKIEGNYVLTDSTLDNGKVAARLFSKASGKVISTCFFEKPYYGSGDFASTISKGTSYVRLTSEDLCSGEDRVLINRLFSGFECNAALSVVPRDVEVSRIGGIFCELEDGSYLGFFALNNKDNSAQNQGLVFSGTLAKKLYFYYRGFADKFRFGVITDASN